MKTIIFTIILCLISNVSFAKIRPSFVYPTNTIEDADQYIEIHPDNGKCRLIVDYYTRTDRYYYQYVGDNISECRIAYQGFAFSYNFLSEQIFIGTDLIVTLEQIVGTVQDISRALVLNIKIPKDVQERIEKTIEESSKRRETLEREKKELSRQFYNHNEN